MSVSKDDWYTLTFVHCFRGIHRVKQDLIDITPSDTLMTAKLFR